MSYEGLNIFNYLEHPKVYIIDMLGKVVHIWSWDAKSMINHAEICSNGDLVAIDNNNQLVVKLDWDSNVKWMKNMSGHHDISIAGNGDIYVLTARNEYIPLISKDKHRRVIWRMMRITNPEKYAIFRF